jgi:Fe-S cluster assembly iron-binding protein IscA
MINLTERTKQELAKHLTWASFGNPEIGLRLIHTEHNQFAVIPDYAKEDDEIVEYKSSKVLLIDPILAQLLEGVTIDYQETTEGACLLIWH